METFIEDLREYPKLGGEHPDILLTTFPVFEITINFPCSPIQRMSFHWVSSPCRVSVLDVWLAAVHSVIYSQSAFKHKNEMQMMNINSQSMINVIAAAEEKLWIFLKFFLLLCRTLTLKDVLLPVISRRH